MKRLLPYGAALVLLAASSGRADAQDVRAGVDAQDVRDRIDALFARFSSDTVPGCALGVRTARESFQLAWGMADLEHGVPNSPRTIFEAGSVSKQFTAAAIILLVLDGTISLDDSVREYVPELPGYANAITLRHLLNHTSGLRDWGSVAAISGWGRSERTHTHDHVLDILARQRGLNFPPGSEYSYSNSGYNLLAIIVGRVSGESFADFSRRRIFEPLGLASTQWRDDYTRIVPGRAAAYAWRDGFVIDRPIENVHGNGGLLTTVDDLLRWNRALAASEFGEPFTRLMHETGVLNDGSTIEYAGGLFITEYRGVREVSHTGATSGYRAFLARYPDQDADIALLCNTATANPGVLGHAVADAVLGSALGARAVPATPPRPVSDGAAFRPPTESQLLELAGYYYSPDAETALTLTIDHGALIVEQRPARRMQLVPVAQDEFNSPLGTIRIIRDEQGLPMQLSLRQARVYDLRFDRMR